MSDSIGADALLIIPCCGTKLPCGTKQADWADKLSQTVTGDCYHAALSARREVLDKLNDHPKFCSKGYSKNRDSHKGPDFGGKEQQGTYRMAIDRYRGRLYSVAPDFPSLVKMSLANESNPRILILSALYGPLHPCSLIQDYNLKMSDPPALETWRNHFGPFLQDYVQTNDIKSIYLYLGCSTAYFGVVKKAIEPLLKLGLRVIHYHVKNGNQNDTPRFHGLKFLSDLGRRPAATLDQRVVQKLL